MALDVADFGRDLKIGTVVPSHTRGGIVQGSSPHKVREHIVNFETGPETMLSLSLGDITNEVVEEARQLAEQIPVETEGRLSIEVERERAALQMKVIGELLARRASKAKEAAASPAASEPAGHAPGGQAATINTSARASGGFSARRVAAAAAVGPSLPSQPDSWVVFDLPGYGEMSVAYHNVIVAGTIVVLVFDTRYTAGRMFRPTAPAEPDAPALYAQLPGAESFLPVYPTGIVFQDEDREYCVLLTD